MAGYLYTIPRQLAARRKALAAAQANPILRPASWAVVRSIAGNLHDYMRSAVIGGCSFPDRPISLSPEDMIFFNFGTVPELLRRDRAAVEAEAAGEPDTGTPLSQEGEKAVRLQLAALAAAYGEDHHETRVYNLEPWFQEMYRDRLDVDFAEQLQKRIAAAEEYMDSVPAALAAAGLRGSMAGEVMDGFNLFKTITGASHKLTREKMSFTDRRGYIETAEKIERIISRADTAVGTAGRRSKIRELYEVWKNANYELMLLNRQLRRLWAGTSLDQRIGEVIGLLDALLKTMIRCAEDARPPTPQLPVFLTDGDVMPRDRGRVVRAFRAVTLFDPVAGCSPVLAAREIRRFGPLSLLLVPGTGRIRYCSEIRRLHTDREAENPETNEKKRPRETELDTARRLRYPLSCLAVPLYSSEDLEKDMADGWLEYCQTAFPVQHNEFLDAAKTAASGMFFPEPRADGTLPPADPRQILAELTAAFVCWTQTGEEPPPETIADFPRFRDMVLGRLDAESFLISPAYRPAVQLFAEAGPRRREEIWRQCLGPRFMLDRELAAVCVLMEDWEGLREHLRVLPPEYVRDNPHLGSAFARVRDASEPFEENRVRALFRKFLLGKPDLKAALVAVESRAAVEAAALRSQAESLGREFQYDQEAEAMLRRQASRIREKRIEADRHIDHYLAGMLHAAEGSPEAAAAALIKCLGQPGPVRDDAPYPGPDEADAWFAETFRTRDGGFETKPQFGCIGPGIPRREFVYYNLGLVYQRMGQWHEAWLAFKGALTAARKDGCYLTGRWAEERIEKARLEMERQTDVTAS